MTIERKTPGQKYGSKDRLSSSSIVDKVEITKIPVGGNSSALSTNGSSSPRLDFYSASSNKSSGNNVLDLSTSKSRGDSPLNLSVKTSAASVTRQKDANQLYNKTNNESSQIPSEYYACEFTYKNDFLFILLETFILDRSIISTYILLHYFQRKHYLGRYWQSRSDNSS